jgi:uncharacterized membrane protein
VCLEAPDEQGSPGSVQRRSFRRHHYDHGIGFESAGRRHVRCAKFCAAGFLSYVLSFIYVGIYWNNHHHLLHASEKVSGGILWANLHLLFWLSLAPFVTAWLGENPRAPVPVALYGAVLLFAGVAYFILTKSLIHRHGMDSRLAISIGSDRKGIASVTVYTAAIPLAFVRPWIACTCYVLVAVMWLLPDPRIERNIRE